MRPEKVATRSLRSPFKQQIEGVPKTIEKAEGGSQGPPQNPERETHRKNPGAKRSPLHPPRSRTQIRLKACRVVSMVLKFWKATLALANCPTMEVKQYLSVQARLCEGVPGWDTPFDKNQLSVSKYRSPGRNCLTSLDGWLTIFPLFQPPKLTHITSTTWGAVEAWLGLSRGP